MKKIGINLIIGFVLTGILIVLALIFVKPNYYLTVLKKDGNTSLVYSSSDNTVFRYENDVITYSKKEYKLTIDINLEGKEKSRMVYFTGGEEKGRLVCDLEGKIFEAKYQKNEYSLEGLDPDEMTLYFKYITLLTVVHEDVRAQKVICSILSVFIAFILSFLVYPTILFDKIKETKNLALICIPITLILCLASAFYIYFTLK